MQRYQYRTLQADITDLAKRELVARLDALGAEGWSLVAAVPHERHGYSHEVHLLFSRAMASIDDGPPEQGKP